MSCDLLQFWWKFTIRNQQTVHYIAGLTSRGWPKASWTCSKQVCIHNPPQSVWLVICDFYEYVVSLFLLPRLFFFTLRFVLDIYKAEKRSENENQIYQIPFLVPKVMIHHLFYCWIDLYLSILFYFNETIYF